MSGMRKTQMTWYLGMWRLWGFHLVCSVIKERRNAYFFYLRSRCSCYVELHLIKLNSLRILCLCIQYIISFKNMLHSFNSCTILNFIDIYLYINWNIYIYKFQATFSAQFENCNCPPIHHKHSCEVSSNADIWTRVKAFMKHVAKLITLSLLSSPMK